MIADPGRKGATRRKRHMLTKSEAEEPARWNIEPAGIGTMEH